MASDKYNKPFAASLRRLLEERNISQTAVANAIGITRQAISFYANGSYEPDNEKLIKLAAYFQVSTDYLLGITDVPVAGTDGGDYKSVCKFTGLSYEAVERLHTGKICCISELSAVMESEHLNQVLQVIEQISDTKKYAAEIECMCFDQEGEPVAGCEEIGDYMSNIKDAAREYGMVAFDSDWALSLLRENAKTEFGKLLEELPYRPHAASDYVPSEPLPPEDLPF